MVRRVGGEEEAQDEKNQRLCTGYLVSSTRGIGVRVDGGC